MSRLKVCLSVAAVMAAVGHGQTSNWITTTGLWGDLANWDANGVPLNAGQSAVINQPGANVTLDSSVLPTIDSLTLGQGTLNITDGSLTLAAPSTAVSPLTMATGTSINVNNTTGAGVLNFVLNGSNNAYSATAADSTSQINIDSNSSLAINSAGTGNTLNLTGGGALSLTNGGILTADPSSASTLNTDFTIHGDGAIQGLAMNFSGSLDTQGLGLQIAPTVGGFTNTTSGVMMATGRLSRWMPRPAERSPIMASSKRMALI